MAASFSYLATHGVLLCRDCGTCLMPARASQEWHLRHPPHDLKGPELRTLLDLFATHELRPPGQVALPDQPCIAIEGLRRHPAFSCILCDDGRPTLTRSGPAIRAHVSREHGQKPSQQSEGGAWQRCTVQTFFAKTEHVRYFVVTDDDRAEGDAATAAIALEPQEQAFFDLADADATMVADDIKTEGNKVHGFDSHPSAAVPWLRRTGIENHVRGLEKDEMHASFALPKSADEGEPELFLMLEVMDEILAEVHGWCFDGPDCMLTWPRQLALSRFHGAPTSSAPASCRAGRVRGFDPKKEPSTLRTNFGYWKQFMAYCYRVAYCGSHFTPPLSADQGRRPEDRIRLTDEQTTAWEAALECAADGDRLALNDALRSLCMALVCHEFGGDRFSSPLLSFCAMLSVKPRTKSWKEPGNFNSCLSGLIWAVQLLIFSTAAYLERSGAGSTLEHINSICEQYLRPDTETPMGEILGWRLLLFAVSKDGVGSHQAHWDEDEQILTYRDVDLNMDEVQQLLLSEFRQAQHLLHGELMFGAAGLPRMRAWALKDNLDADNFSWHFGEHRENAALLKPLAGSLRNVIRESQSLRASFLDTTAAPTAEDGEDGEADAGVTRVMWRQKAIDQYEAVADEFLKRLLVLIHMASGQPLRESELFSLTWRNTQRRRSVYLKHGLVMLHTTYHKGQQQTGRFKDNIRFLPAAIGDLLLDYLVYVVPLRQAFLRQSSPRAIMSAYLWWKDGAVWADNRLTRCMEQACVRAKVPRLHIANWRQMTVNIVKTKFAGDLACFEGIGADDDDEDAEEMEDDIRTMTRQRNHSTRVVNRSYANQLNANFGNVWDGLIRRNLRASSLWRGLWDLDTVLGDAVAAAGKRKREAAEVAGSDRPRMLKRIAVGVHRPRKRWSAAALLKCARGLYHDDKLQWKSAAQERAMTVVMSWTEQVVVILGTGEGKSLLFMLPCVLPDAGVTILVLPLVSLRGDLLRRVQELGIDHLVWAPGEERDAPLVFVTVEAASTSQFRAYAHRLAATQQLGRVVIDEAHLTITASEYRHAMADLALIRSVRTQFVYLTATLPPMLQAAFERQNNLVKPKVVRASTNRRNLSYLVQRATGQGSLLEEGARRARDAWRASGLLDQTRDKIILYVRTREEAQDLGSLLRCPVYTAMAGTAEEKQELLRTWLTTPELPYIVATSALSAGFDYPHVRLVMHLDEPRSLVDFAQESGRAGRDGREAYSAVLLPHKWQSQAGNAGMDVETRALYRYLEGRECRRTCLSAHLDEASELRQCDGTRDDVACDVCSSGPSPSHVPRDDATEAMPHTGSAAIHEKRRLAYLELSRYKEDLLTVKGTCLLCRGLGEQWDHQFTKCHQRFDFFRARDQARRRGQGRGPWISAFAACYGCYNPQSVCQRADPASGLEQCRYADIVMPLCYGVFHKTGGEQWLQERFGEQAVRAGAAGAFNDVDVFLSWCGQVAEFAGGKGIWGVKIAAAALLEFEAY